MECKRKKDKLLWVSHMIPYPPKAGLLNRSYNIIRELSNEYDLDLFCLSQRQLVEPYFENYSLGVQESIRTLQTYCVNLHIESKPIVSSFLRKTFLTIKSLLKKYPYSIEWLSSKSFKKSIERQLSLSEYDLIYIDTISLIKNIDLKKLHGKTILIGHHNIESEMMKRRSFNTKNFAMKTLYWIEYKKLLRIEKKISREIDLNVVCSYDDKKVLDSICETTNSIVVPNGFDFGLIENFKRDPKTNSLLFIGTMDWYPNVDAITYFYDDIWKRLKLEVPDIEIDIIGSNPPERLVKIQENDPSFRVHGFVEDISNFLSSASVYVCPIRDGGGTKLKLIEAFAHRIPCVANPISCEGIEVENMQHVLHASNPDEYVECIKSILESRVNGHELAERAFESIFAKYNYEKIAKDFTKSVTAYRSTKCAE
ncbi:glycosyltransferase family 4 protein [Saccharospirillum alexandrii]|uniref:glycosyltransferase family 4 protein n=1 Tax=Saccharospirillum alexandrii TaxID=2448477 RepID=UPI0013DF33CC|nr:glycosyltransferase family 4 protein [Saccharospirillum alexandrii]